MLKPEKEHVYLNYRCEIWSKSLQLLYEYGYTVYRYEPYAKDCINLFLITNGDELVKIRFYGIYSNNLLEHLINPTKKL